MSPPPPSPPPPPFPPNPSTPPSNGTETIPIAPFSFFCRKCQQMARGEETLVCRALRYRCLSGYLTPPSHQHPMGETLRCERPSKSLRSWNAFTAGIDALHCPLGWITLIGMDALDGSRQDTLVPEFSAAVKSLQNGIQQLSEDANHASIPVCVVLVFHLETVGGGQQCIQYTPKGFIESQSWVQSSSGGTPDARTKCHEHPGEPPRRRYSSFLRIAEKHILA